jgi:ubiquinone/menaquinone biosynthesis C-methylase UbiE
MSTNEVARKVRDHFDDDAVRFDAIYEQKKGIAASFIDNFWRGVVQKRLELNIEKLKPFEGKTVLDVGCGSGRFCLEYAKNNAKHVVGVDFAAAMIEIANQLAKKMKVEKQCEFRVGAFPEVVAGEKFDYSTANGFFDYIEDPVAIISAMREVTKEKMILSFPKAFEWRVPVRRVRFWMKGTPLFLYTKKQTEDILRAAGVEKYDWINLDRDYLIIAHLK